MAGVKSLFVTLKATLNCNLGCLYCYGRDNASIMKEMSDEEVKSALKFVCEYARLSGVGHVSICWHGGEPLLFSPKRLEELCDYAAELFVSYGIRHEFGIQTNAVRLTPEYHDLIRKHFNGYVGVSLDMFSDFRLFRNGKPSSDIVVENIDAALKAGIRCGSINLVTRHNVDRIDEIYEFYKARQMNVRLARVFPISADFDLSNPMYVSDEEFAGAMIRYFDLWAADPQPANNTDIVKLVGDLLLGRPSICLREQNCSKRYLALAPGGDIYPCAEFDVPESVIGNFLSQTPEEFHRSDLRQRIFDKAPVPSECSGCRYETTCYGGCLRERFMVGYPFRCKSNIIYWDHIVRWLEGKGASLYALRGKSKEECVELLNSVFSR